MKRLEKVSTSIVYSIGTQAVRLRDREIVGAWHHHELHLVLGIVHQGSEYNLWGVVTLKL